MALYSYLMRITDANGTTNEGTFAIDFENPTAGNSSATPPPPQGHHGRLGGSEPASYYTNVILGTLSAPSLFDEMAAKGITNTLEGVFIFGWASGESTSNATTSMIFAPYTTDLLQIAGSLTYRPDGSASNEQYFTFFGEIV